MESKQLEELLDVLRSRNVAEFKQGELHIKFYETMPGPQTVQPEDEDDKKKRLLKEIRETVADDDKSLFWSAD